MSGDRVAIVAQRFHKKVVGGSETLARQYAELLSIYYEVDVLTSCALDYMTWKNELPEGVEAGPGYSIIRFPAVSERSGYWQRLDRLLHRGIDPARFASRAEDKALLTRQLAGWPLALQEEYIKAQGPHCPGLYDYLAANGGNYRAIFFITYLYSTAYFGSHMVDGRRSVFVPTFHDEPCAYFSAFGSVFERAGEVVYLTEAERSVAKVIQGCNKGEVVGMAIDIPESPAVRKEDGPPFIIYTGRVDENKGCATLLEYFQRYKKRRPSDLSLVLTGHKVMDIPDRDDIKFLGFVPEDEKWALLGNALAFAHLGCYESFSISALEALASSTPLIVNGCCRVLAEHCNASGSGYVIDGYDEFEKAIDVLSRADGGNRVVMGAKGRQYVHSRYSREAVAGKLRRIVENISPGMPAETPGPQPQVVETLKRRVEERVRSLKSSREPEGIARAMLAQADLVQKADAGLERMKADGSLSLDSCQAVSGFGAEGGREPARKRPLINVLKPVRSLLKGAVLKVASGNRRIIDPLKALDAMLTGKVIEAREKEDVTAAKPAARPVPTVAGDVRVSVKGIFSRSQRPVNILLIKLDHLGDLILAIPAILRLRKKFINPDIDIIVGKWNVPLAKRLGVFRNIYTFNFYSTRSSVRPEVRAEEEQRLVEGLGAYDIAVDLRRPPDSRFLIAKVPARFKAAYRSFDENERCLDICLDAEQDRPHISNPLNRRNMSLQLLDLVEAIPIESVEVPPLGKRLPDGNQVAFFPGAGSEIKQWPMEYFAELARKLLEMDGGLKINIYLSKDEGAQASFFDTLKTGVYIHVGLDIDGLVDSLQQNSAAVANNSFGAHISSIAGVPVLAIFGGHETVEEWFPPFGKNVVLSSDVDCSLCHLGDPSECKSGFVCLTAITPGAAADALKKMLDEGPVETGPFVLTFTHDGRMGKAGNFVRAGGAKEYQQPDRGGGAKKVGGNPVAYALKALRSLAKKILYFVFGKRSGIIEPLKALDAKIRDRFYRYTLGKSSKQAIKDSGIKTAAFGVNVSGFFEGEFGLGEAARSDTRCLENAGIPFALNSLAAAGHSGKDSTLEAHYSSGNPYRFNLIHVNIDTVHSFIMDKGSNYFSDRYNIASWVWEAPVVPEKFLPAFKYFNEIWTLSRYSMDILSRVSPVPVIRIPCSIDIAAGGSTRFRVRPDRARFGLSEDEYVFLMMFDFRSFIERKNPLAAVRAFRAAFKPGEKVRLVIKHINSQMHKDDLAHFNKELDGLNVKVIDGHLRRDEVVSLIASCDCSVSLHRAEGFGLTIAEAMALGKPVIATDYSGNTDFMDVGNSFPVRYKLVEQGGDFPPYVKGGLWADPDVGHAAELMRLVYEDRELAADRGRKAERDIRERFSPAKVGELYKGRLTHIEKYIL